MESDALAASLSEQEKTLVWGQFPQTRWTLVQQFHGTDNQDARLALEELCRRYWPPVYAFIRRRGYAADLTEDLTQEFFHRLIKRGRLGEVEETKGRLRTYIIASVRNMIVNEHRKETALKRGGGETPLPLDMTVAEDAYQNQVMASSPSPDVCFERRWALTLIENALTQLGRDYEEAGKAAVFETLKEYLLSGSEYGSYAKAGEPLGLSATATQVAVHRLRKRFRQCMIDQVMHTVGDPDEVEAELTHILQVFSQ